MKNITLTHLIIPVLFVSSLTIAGLASANLNEKNHCNIKVFEAKKLDKNHDGLVSLKELTSQRDIRFKKLDADNDGQIKKNEFNVSIRNMFYRMDTDRDGFLSDYEISQVGPKN